MLRLLGLLPSPWRPSTSLSESESAAYEDLEAELGLTLRLNPLTSLSNDDIWRNSGSRFESLLLPPALLELSPTISFGGPLILFARELMRVKLLSLASVLWFDVSERALSVGEGGAKSGKGYSGMGIFQ